jgi:mannitol-1-phosphate 5-dehydrogenase
LEYPLAYDGTELADHIEDLLQRFGNAALGDTLFRVGRDLPRKLDRSDRIVGAALLCERRGLPWDGIARVFGAALRFRATDEMGRPFQADVDFLASLRTRGLPAILNEVCRLDPADEVDRRVAAGLASAYNPAP